MRTRLKIVHIIPELGIGGAEGMLLRLIGTDKAKCEEHVLISLRRDDKHADRFLKLGIKVHFIGMSFLPSPLTIWNCTKAIKEENPNLISTWLYLGDLVGTLSKLIIKNAPPIVWNVRCSDAQDKDWRLARWLVTKFLVLLSPLAQKIICNSQKGIEYHKRVGYKNSQWCLISNGFDTEQFKPSESSRKKLRETLGIPLAANVIGIVARYDNLKDYPTFLKAAKVLQIRYPELHFILAGDGIVDSNPVLIPLLRQLSRSKNVHLLGKRSDVAELLNAFDIFTLTSLSEGFPNVLGEAMATGLFCIATDVGASKEVLGDAGYIIQPQNVDELVRSWEKALALTKSDLQKYKTLARERILKNYSLATITGKYRNIYANLIQNTPQIGPILTNI